MSLLRTVYLGAILCGWMAFGGWFAAEILRQGVTQPGSAAGPNDPADAPRFLGSQTLGSVLGEREESDNRSVLPGGCRDWCGSRPCRWPVELAAPTAGSADVARVCGRWCRWCRGGLGGCHDLPSILAGLGRRIKRRNPIVAQASRLDGGRRAGRSGRWTIHAFADPDAQRPDRRPGRRPDRRHSL